MSHLSSHAEHDLPSVVADATMRRELAEINGERRHVPQGVLDGDATNAAYWEWLRGQEQREART